jgi:hypothetical protein
MKNTRGYLFKIAFISTVAIINAESILQQVSSSDESLLILRTMYGSVNGLTGGVDGLTALMFKIFNISALVFASVFFGTTITQNVVSSASQGVFMGKKQSQSAYFTMFRSMSGMLAIFPQYNGYSLIQTLVMTVVLKSIVLAGNVSDTILEEYMKNPFTQIIETTRGQGKEAEAKTASFLSNDNVSKFYNTVYSMAKDSVIYDRQAPAGQRVSKATDLYKIKSVPNSSSSATTFELKFKGSSKKIELNSYQDYDIYFQSILGQLINPVVKKLYSCLPAVDPEDSKARSCSVMDSAEGPCGGQTEEDIKHSLKLNIQNTHDGFAPMFVMKLVEDKEPPPIAVTGYRNNWTYFPFLLQMAMDAQGEGLAAGNLDELVEKSLRWNGDTFAPRADLYTPNYTSLGGKTEDNPIIKFISESDPESGLSGGDGFESLFPNPFSNVVVSSSTNDIDANNRINQALGNILGSAQEKLNSGGGAYNHTKTRLNNHSRSLVDQWNSLSLHSYSATDGAIHAERVAMKDPVAAFISETGNKWMETFLGADARIQKSPISALTEMSAELANKSTLFMLLLMRNVLAEQILNAARAFWEFFSIRMGFMVTKSLLAMKQEQLHDQLDCDMLNVVMGPGLSPRVPICPPLFVTLVPFPVPNPLWMAHFGVAMGMVIPVTIAHTAVSLADEAVASAYTYHYMLKSQFEYAYYGYIVAAATPVMIVSNLLSIWIPMLPALVFFIAIVGWCFAVLEAMIASPLILVGMTFPQGHDFLGASQQALILLLGVFVRAPLIVVGFFVGTLLVAISMMMLSYALVPLILSAFPVDAGSLGDGLMVYAFMIVVLYLTISVMSQALSITYKLPNIILSWIGGQRTEGVEAAAVQQIISVVTGQVQGPLRAIQTAGMSTKSGQMSSQAVGGFSTAGKMGND